MKQDEHKKRPYHKIKRTITRLALPVLNPRDLIDPIAECILDLDPHAEFILMITDPRDHRQMSVRTVLHEPTKGTFMRTLTQGLWPVEEDGLDGPRVKVRTIEPPKESNEQPL